MSDRSSKAVNAWAIKHWNSGLYPETVRETRWQAIEAFEDQFLVNWREESKYGVHKAVKVIVSLAVAKP